MPLGHCGHLSLCCMLEIDSLMTYQLCETKRGGIHLKGWGYGSISTTTMRDKASGFSFQVCCESVHGRSLPAIMGLYPYWNFQYTSQPLFFFVSFRSDAGEHCLMQQRYLVGQVPLCTQKLKVLHRWFL